jgi:opine dehydrogenase
MTRIAVLGAGAGGCAAAVDFVRRGAEVRLYNRSADRLEPIRSQGGLNVTGPLVNGFVGIPVITSRLEQALDGADLIWILTTAQGHAHYAEACAPHLRDGQTIVLSPGSAGSLVMRQILRTRGVRARVALVETLTLPNAARLLEPGTVTIYTRIRLRTAALPARDTPLAIERLRSFIDPIPATNILELTLLNPNYLIHPVPYLMNLGEIERNDGHFAIYGLGWTPSVLKSMRAIDAEKMAVCRKLGLPAPDIDTVYDEFGTGPIYRQSADAARTRVDTIPKVYDRFLDEDVPLGLVTLASVGRMVGVPTPVSDAVIQLASTVQGVDYRKTGRTVEALGIAGKSPVELRRYLHEEAW